MQPLRVLQVLTLNRNSGVASFVMSLYRNINKDKIQFDFLTWVVDENLPTYNDEIHSYGGKIYTIPYYKHNFLWFIKTVSELLSTEQISMIHCHEFLVNIPMLYLAKKQNIPVRIAHSHNPTIDGYLKKFIVKFCQPIFKNLSTHFMACSQQSGEFLFGVDVAVTVINNSIDGEKFRYDEKKRVASRANLGIQDAFVLGSIGRLTDQKNPLYLLDIFYSVWKERDDAVLLLIGEGELKEKLVCKTKELKIENYVYFLGTRSDIPDLLNAMDCFVLPSLYEGFGIVLLEAQTAGLVCFASDAIPIETKISEYIHYLPISAAPKIWATAILKSNSAHREFGIQRLEESDFNISRTVKALEQYYLSIMEV